MSSPLPRRTLLITHDFPPLLGGVSTCALNLSCALAARGVQIKVLTLRREGANAVDGGLSFPVSRAPYRRPYYLFAHGVEILESEATLWKLVRKQFAFLKRRVFREAQRTFAVSHFTRNLVVEECRLPLSKVQVAPNGVDAVRFHPSPKPPLFLERYGAKGRFVFLTLTRLDDYKGVDLAIEAMRLLRRVHPQALYLIGGRGPDRSRLEGLVRRYDLGEHVHFLGSVPQAELPDHYNLADCFLLASREDRSAPNVEGFGIVFLEAAACAKPVLAGASGGISDAVVNGRTGWLVDPADATALAYAMAGLVREPQLGELAGLRARERASTEFTWANTGQLVAEAMARHVRN
jgi:phosphatidylinositol alpha-1,6-mannosyltransferase